MKFPDLSFWWQLAQGAYYHLRKMYYSSGSVLSQLSEKEYQHGVRKTVEPLTEDRKVVRLMPRGADEE